MPSKRVEKRQGLIGCIGQGSMGKPNLGSDSTKHLGPHLMTLLNAGPKPCWFLMWCTMQLRLCTPQPLFSQLSSSNYSMVSPVAMLPLRPGCAGDGTQRACVCVLGGERCGVKGSVLAMRRGNRRGAWHITTNPLWHFLIALSIYAAQQRRMLESMCLGW